MFQREPIFHDRSCVHVDGGFSTTSLTLVDIPGATYTVLDLGSEGRYEFVCSLEIEGNVNNWVGNTGITVNGNLIASRTIQRGGSSRDDPMEVTLTGCVGQIVEGDVFQVQMSTASGTLTLNALDLFIDGIPEIRIVT